MNMQIKLIMASVALVIYGAATAQSDQTYATYITEEEWQGVNELPGVDRQIVSRDIGKLNLFTAMRWSEPAVVPMKTPKTPAAPKTAAVIVWQGVSCICIRPKLITLPLVQAPL